MQRLMRALLALLLAPTWALAGSTIHSTDAGWDLVRTPELIAQMDAAARAVTHDNMSSAEWTALQATVEGLSDTPPAIKQDSGQWVMLPAWKQSVTLGGGITASQGLGEGRFSGTVLMRADSKRTRIEASWDSADKVVPGSSAGWIGGIGGDYLAKHIFVGLAYRHRDGGTWTKNRAWASGGLRHRWENAEGRLTLASALSSRDRETKVSASLLWYLNASWGLEPVVSALYYDQGAASPNRRWGTTTSLRVLWRAQGDR